MDAILNFFIAFNSHRYLSGSIFISILFISYEVQYLITAEHCLIIPRLNYPLIVGLWSAFYSSIPDFYSNTRTLSQQ